MASIHEETVAFIEATDWLREEKGIDFKTIAKEIGISQSQMSMIRIERRKIKEREVEKLVSIYPEVKHYFNNPSLSITNEPMEPYLNGGGNNTLKELIEIQRKLIARLEEENKLSQTKILQLEMENKALRDIFNQKR